MKTRIDTTQVPAIADARVAILKSKWHTDLVESMAAPCRAHLRAFGCAAIEEHVLPGCLELPVAADILLARPHALIDAVICFGVILKGETLHFEMISQQAFQGLGQVSVRRQVPIIVEILPVFELAQARARARDDEFNKGIEAAAAAAEMIAWRRGLG